MRILCVVSNDKKGVPNKIPLSFLDRLPPDQQEEYGCGKGHSFVLNGKLYRFHGGWPDVRSVLKPNSSNDPYAEPEEDTE